MPGHSLPEVPTESPMLLTLEVFDFGKEFKLFTSGVNILMYLLSS